MIPFRIAFLPLGDVDDETLRQNLDASQHIPRAQAEEHEHPVAVAGGGPLLDIEALRKWPGDIWAVNRTADYLLDRGIDCTMFTVDPAVSETTAAKRLIATHCHPDLFAGDVRCFALCEYEDGGIPGGTTSALRTPALAMRLGYPGVVFFGCESSFGDFDHIDRDEQLPDALIVRAAGRDYKTRPDLLLQAQQMADLLVQFPQYLSERSGGLLSAMCADPQWSIVAVSDAMKKHLIEVNGDTGLYDGHYARHALDCGLCCGLAKCDCGVTQEEEASCSG